MTIISKFYIIYLRDNKNNYNVIKTVINKRIKKNQPSEFVNNLTIYHILKDLLELIKDKTKMDQNYFVESKKNTIRAEE